ncbi:type IV secretory system conjugative DNA transfer family protein [Mycolicibacterium goodii]|uniref:TraM recognition domain-containing protein n=1 Tax=Mycolicibacterium goodii TaxID=134601 RepID=UPI001BDD77B7|nr:type IV secretory system conjugative DNA transfer family protein [Mycolicibacterium goodii]MBU8817530.1 type IV secretory system conjugative DNA transfer family protein [Mycolicibacterium goodii]
MGLIAPKTMPTPYAGIYTDPSTNKTFAPRTRPHVLVSAPTGGGKTVLLASSSICHPGALIAVSSKYDLMQKISTRRVGPAYLIDLRQIETPHYGSHIMQCRIDPTLLIERHDDALNMATWLHRTAGLSMGGRITSHDEPYWAYQIIPALAALLWAASPRGNGQGIEWLMHAVENPFKPAPPQPPEPVKIPNPTEQELNYMIARERVKEINSDPNAKPSDKKKAERDEYLAKVAYENALAEREAAKRAAEAAAAMAAAMDMDKSPEERRIERLSAGEDPAVVYAELPPSWWDARPYFASIPWSALPTRLERIATLSDRQRDSVALGMSAALFPWVYESVRRQDLPVFDPMWLNDPQANLFILAEPEGGGVGAALPLVQAIVSIWRRKSSMDLLDHNLMLTIDELTNTLPLPTLDILVSEARGLGINLLVALQAAQQIAHRYDPIFMETLLRIFPAMLVMHGSAEMEMLEQGSLWSGITTRSKESLDQTTGNRLISLEEGPRFTAQELQPRAQYRGRLLYRGSAGIEVELPSFEQFLHMYDNNTVEGLVRI